MINAKILKFFPCKQQNWNFVIFKLSSGAHLVEINKYFPDVFLLKIQKLWCLKRVRSNKLQFLRFYKTLQLSKLKLSKKSMQLWKIPDNDSKKDVNGIILPFNFTGMVASPRNDKTDDT